ncbi:mitochondrial import inner membrane translocase subunit TIM50-C [Acyrthosiphon pisum]|uniref:Mitochondrial import inner membrane translocase subunit TIM50 n=1 Tax=Acyrthosiphon pisum TaxID=7029 RepID=A0A8R2A2R9_ACYPI|nr:mitochondrial import inner membrane translocase subunit TIM50-C [Acyrthosiphon pisum]|eukprot:XP_001949077.2 PREDICTED: mitochondrial import inner membrane translocase subunit TIM50-C-like [Acyrthosiphon pisum]
MNTCACNYKLINILTLNSKYNQNTFLSSHHIWSKYQHVILPRSVSNSSVRTEKSRLKQLLIRSLKIASMAFGVSLIAFGGYSLVFEDDELVQKGNKNIPLIIKIYERLCFKIEFYHKMFTIPATKKLLPDSLPDYYDKPQYTLVLEITDLLVHPEWSYSTGWRFKKRPNVDYFLERVGKIFEVVVYTAENGYIASPILDEIDPKGWIQYRLSRQCTEFRNGQLVKNIERINRDLSKVIVIDWNTSWTQLHPYNTLIIPRWNGDENDNSLIDLADFLKVIFEKEEKDARDILNRYKKYDDPIKAFREDQRILKEETKDEEEKEQEINKIEDNNKSWFSWISWIY